ncbi:hypothetical protein LTR56_028270, partial [Elasticomyces elasticus]
LLWDVKQVSPGGWKAELEAAAEEESQLLVQDMLGLTVSEQVPLSAIVKSDNGNDGARYEQSGIARPIEKTRPVRKTAFRPSSERGSEREAGNLEETPKALSRKS